MSEVQQPLTLKFNGSGPQTIRDADGTAADEESLLVVITSPQSGPPVPITPSGAPLDMTVAVQTPYSLTMPPGAIVVG